MSSEHEQGSPFAMLGDEERGALSRGNCPACGSRGFVIGPGAFPDRPTQPLLPAMFQINIECANVDCRSRYNVSFRSGWVLMAHDLFDGKAGPPWPSEPRQ